MRGGNAREDTTFCPPKKAFGKERPTVSAYHCTQYRGQKGAQRSILSGMTDDMHQHIEEHDLTVLSSTGGRRLERSTASDSQDHT